MLSLKGPSKSIITPLVDKLWNPDKLVFLFLLLHHSKIVAIRTIDHQKKKSF